MLEVIDVDHAEVGAMLAEKWRFAPHLVESIRHLHTPEQYDTDMMACVFAANQITQRLGLDYGGCLVETPFSATVAKRLAGQLDAVQASLGDLGPLLNESRLFSSI